MKINRLLGWLILAICLGLTETLRAVEWPAVAPPDTILIVDSLGNIHKMAVYKPKKQKKPKTQKRAAMRPQRIDREVMKTVFIPRGTYMAGGTVYYQEHDEKNLNFLVIKDVDALGYTFSLSPYGGYFFRDNMAAGVRFTYKRTYLDMNNFKLNLGEDFNINLDNLYWLEHKYVVGGFLRTCMPIGKSKIFGLFNEVQLNYGYSEGKNSTGSGTEYDGTYEVTHSLQLGISPGMTAFITNWSAVEVSLGVMGYNFNWVKQTTNQIEIGRRRNSGGSFKINLFSINIGMTFYL